MPSAEEAREVREAQDKVILEHKRKIVEHILATDEPDKETW
jgi:hypothetical protein